MALSVVDLRSRHLPDPMVATLLAGLIVLDAATALSGGRPESLLWACAGGLSYGGLLLMVKVLAPSGLGGDVKLAVPLGWQIGFAGGTGFPTAALMALLIACLSAPGVAGDGTPPGAPVAPDAGLRSVAWSRSRPRRFDPTKRYSPEPEGPHK